MGGRSPRSFVIVNEIDARRRSRTRRARVAARRRHRSGWRTTPSSIARDGREIPIDDSAAPIRDPQGRVHGCILVFRDISERKAAEREIGEAQARLQRVVTDMAIPTMVFADDGEIVLVNAAWTGISGFAAAELRTLPAWTRNAYGERAEAMNAVIARLFELEESVDNGEREITTASGEKRIWHFVTAPIGRDAKGRRMLVTNAIDVTERRRLEQAARREGSAHASAAMDGGELDGDSGVESRQRRGWSGPTQMRELVGVGSDEPISFEPFAGSALHPDDRRQREAQRSPSLGDRRANAPSTASSAAIGDVRWISVAGRSCVAPTAAIGCSASSATSTEQKRALSSRSRDADRRKDEFLAMLAHELRNPLAPIRNALAILQRWRRRPATLRAGARR